uniref:Uncharacterized protein n=1 Tax=Anopheles culicifacies TaxID=139723 RepID=A0A182M2N7_9DIPT
MHPQQDSQSCVRGKRPEWDSNLGPLRSKTGASISSATEPLQTISPALIDCSSDNLEVRSCGPDKLDTGRSSTGSPLSDRSGDASIEHSPDVPYSATKLQRVPLLKQVAQFQFKLIASHVTLVHHVQG